MKLLKMFHNVSVNHGLSIQNMVWRKSKPNHISFEDRKAPADQMRIIFLWRCSPGVPDYKVDLFMHEVRALVLYTLAKSVGVWKIVSRSHPLSTISSSQL
jgi:hypothetical protein